MTLRHAVHVVEEWMLVVALLCIIVALSPFRLAADLLDRRRPRA
jgi:hypothetical protein